MGKVVYLCNYKRRKSIADRLAKINELMAELRKLADNERRRSK
jgi:hypothetical protein